MEVFNQIFLVVFFQAIFFIILILKKSEKEAQHYFLGFLLFLFALESLLIYYFQNYTVTKGLFYYLVNIFIWTLLGPTLYLYISYNIKPRKNLRAKDLFHIIPLIITYLTTYNFLIENGESLSFSVITDSENIWYAKIGVRIWQYTTQIYFLATIVILIYHKKRVLNYFSNSKSVDLKWILFFSIMFAIYLYYGQVYLLFLEFSDIKIISNIDYISAIILLFYVFGIGYFGFNQKNIFAGNNISEKDYNKVVRSLKYSHSSEDKQKNILNDKETERLKSNLFEIMKNERPYLDQELNLTILADKVGTSANKLSQLLNDNLNKSFSDFINSYRVNEVKRMLENEKHKNYTILAVAYECGFNSKTAFYNTFKKSVGVTPTKYRKSI